MDDALIPRLRLARAPCPCCGFQTLDAPGKHEICILCNWEDEGLGEAELDERSGANHGYTLRDARRNFARRLNIYGEDDPAARETHETFAAKQHIISALQTLGTLPAVKHERLWALIERTETVLRAERQRRRLQPEEEIKRLTPIGYWHSENGDGLPHPQSLVSWTWQFGRRWRIVRYLRKGSVYVQYGGCSYCRFGCWRTFLGSKDLTDGVWVWPEGLAHYVATHGVRLPDEFVAHARRHAFRAPGLPASPRLAWEHDWTFWNEWSRNHATFDYEPNCLACAFPGDTLCSNALAFWRRLGRRLFRPVLVWRGRRLQVDSRSRRAGT
jgi:hypothetical protein